MLNNNGKVTLRNGSPYWYSSYVSYAVDNGIIEKMYLDYTPAQMNTPVKRNEFVHIFYGAMSDYRQINTVADNKIPGRHNNGYLRIGDLYVLSRGHSDRF